MVSSSRIRCAARPAGVAVAGVAVQLFVWRACGRVKADSTAVPPIMSIAIEWNHWKGMYLFTKGIALQYHNRGTPSGQTSLHNLKGKALPRACVYDLSTSFELGVGLPLPRR